MPLALDVSMSALAFYDHLLRRDAQGLPAFGISQGLKRDRLVWDDFKNQAAWRELVDVGLAVESPDYGRYSKYTYRRQRDDAAAGTDDLDR